MTGAASDHELFALGDVTLLSGAVLPDAKLAYKTWGTLAADGGNVVVLPTFYTGTHRRNAGYIGAGRPSKRISIRSSLSRMSACT